MKSDHLQTFPLPGNLVPDKLRQLLAPDDVDANTRIDVLERYEHDMHGPDREQHSHEPEEVVATFDAIAADAKLVAATLHAAEKTSTTKRKRRVGWFEWEQYRKACALNAPTDVVLAFADFVEGTNSNARRFEQLGSKTIKFIEELERVAQAPVSLINTRFPRDHHGVGDLRTIIDRRNWTALRSRDRDAS